jgi:adenine specific DNA methylase Mod
MKYVVSRASGECVCGLNGCPNEINEAEVNEGCMNRLVLLDDEDKMLEFNSLGDAYNYLSVHIPTDRLNKELKDKIISIDPMEFE